MIDAIKRAWSRLRAEDHSEMVTPADVTTTFVLQFEDLPVGFLTLANGIWQFSYSEEFKRQSEVKPLVDFPQLEKVYRNDHLWPFFLARIPSLSQPQVEETIRREGLDRNSSAALLRRFGERTISNPFVLQTTG